MPRRGSPSKMKGLSMTSENDPKDVDAHTGVETTGHSWDGIRELNNPLPRWWLYTFYICVAWAVVYMILMPAIPALPFTGGSHTPGVRAHSDRAIINTTMADIAATRRTEADALLGASLEEIETDRNLQQFAFAMGDSLFGDNCATCHGSGGQGAKGYPSLVDDVWLWDGTLDGIQYTLRHGIRQEGDAETRFSMMPRFGADGLLQTSDIRDLTQYVVHLSGGDADAEAITRAAPIYAAQCAFCHGSEGLGDRTQGAPDLTDAEWLYGGEASEIYDTIYNARNSHMPAWSGRLSEAEIKALSVYVHSFGGGE